MTGQVLHDSVSKLTVFGSRDEVGVSSAPECPACGYVLDRPHALTCSRCRAEIPLARGCSGCGKCRKG